jgi:carboxypeptidase Taq
MWAGVLYGDVKPEQAYQELVRRSRDETLLGSCLDLLEWDEEVAMPRGGVEHRAEQMALLAGLVHDRGTDPRYEELLDAVEGSPLVRDAEWPEAVNVRELRRAFDRERKKPRRLVEESARVQARASQAWADARERDDFQTFAPWLERVFALAREEADAVGYTGERYQAFLDEYEPGMTLGRLKALFDRLETALAPLANAVRVTRPPPSADVLAREFTLDHQPGFARQVAGALGFDLECGRLDVGQHPFCTVIGPGDIRMALRYYARDFARGFFALLHETGHALYDQALDPAHYGTPMGEAASPGMHESQSRLWENLVGRSPGFWRHFYPQLLGAFPEPLRDVSMDTFRAAVNRVVPGPIRAQADEVTYDLHIIIRFELERALLAGELRGADLPGAWTELYKKHLGVVPQDHRTGCLQDGHWAEGMIGYFPTYTLGNIYAAQLYAAAERAVGPLDEQFARGDFRTLAAWLGEHVYRHARRYTAEALVERATGQPPEPTALIARLSDRYRPAKD